MILGRLTILDLAKLCGSLDKCSSCPFYLKDLDSCLFREAYMPKEYLKWRRLNENI